MKNISLFLFSIFTALCISCSDDSVSNNDIIGRYRLIAKTENGESIFNDCKGESFIEFTDSNYKEAKFNDESESNLCTVLFDNGTYEINSPVLMTRGEINVFSSYNISFNNTNLVLTDTFTLINVDGSEEFFEIIETWQETTEDFPVESSEN